MTIEEEARERMMEDGTHAPTFYVCMSCQEVREAHEYVDKCAACGWVGTHGEATTRDGAFALVEEYKKPGFNRLLGRKNPLGVPRTQEELIVDAHVDKVLGELKNMSALLDEGVPDIEWLVEGLVPSRSLTILAAEAGCYKTYLALHLSICVATGQRFLDQYDLMQGKVLYLDEENGLINLVRRSKQLVDGHGALSPKELFLSVSPGFALDDPRLGGVIHDVVVSTRPVLVVVDSMVRFMRGEEDKSTDVRRVFENLKRAMDAHPCAVVVLHHLRKNDNKGMRGLRGSGDFAAMADLVLLLAQNRGGVVLTTKKHRFVDTERLRPLRIDVVSDGGEGPFKFVYQGDLPKPKDRVARCWEELAEWIKKDRVETFQTSAGLSRMKTKGHSKNAYYEVLKKMREEGFIAENVRGTNMVQKGMFHVEEERFHE